MAIDISVIIPHHDDKNNLEHCLEALFRDLPANAEVIVVDDGSIAPSLSLLKKYPFKLLELRDNKGPAYARNWGARESQGSLLMFIDADCIPMPGWVNCFVRALREEPQKKAVITGRLESPPEFMARCHAYAGYGFVLGGPARQTTHLNTACAALHKNAFRDVGGFSEDMQVSEDCDLGFKLIEHGYGLFFEPSIHVFHAHGIRTLRELMAKHYEWGRHVGLTLMRRHKERFKTVLPLLSHPTLHLLFLVPLAVLTTLRLVIFNARWDSKVWLYAPFIFLSKLSYRWGIFIRSARRTL
jgi:GT2 family glycosyltransferase